MITLESSWPEIIGDKEPAKRMENWRAWLALSDDDAREYWNDDSACAGCVHLKKNPFAWCSLVGLPATVNPLLTIKHGTIGMACAGAAYEPQGAMQEVMDL
jgi:hypothetical protein